jgi:palmitoyltransferase
MSFWYDILFDDGMLDDPQEVMAEELGPFRSEVSRTEVQHWLERNSRMCAKARALLTNYVRHQAHKPPGTLAPISPLAWNWLPEGTVKIRADDPNDVQKINPVWDPEIGDKFDQDKLYGRVSREVDLWWMRARDPNYEEWAIPTFTVDEASKRQKFCKANILGRYAHLFHPEGHEAEVVEVESVADEDSVVQHYPDDYPDDMLDDDDIDDDDSYDGEGPLTGLLTEIPNILDPKQIEALHMIVKSCILDTAGSGLTKAGENLQKTRCRLFIALICGKSLLREILVFIAVWEKDEQSLIYQLTTQIVEAIHHSALIPYTWSSLKIPKDIISPAQTVLLRLINHMFRARINNPPQTNSKENSRDLKLVQFFFNFFRSKIVPECVALMSLQAKMREDNCDPAEFPIDSWDMERAKDGLAQYLDFLTTVSEIMETRQKLIEWECIYDLIALLNGLEEGVPKKPLVELPNRTPHTNDSHSSTLVERPYSTGPDSRGISPPPPPMHEPAHIFPWSGVKGQIFTIIATLLQPPPGQSSPGNAAVQMQMVQFNGIVPLLNCCTYDDHNPFAKERVTICLKWLLDGSEAANNFFRELVNITPPANLRPPPGGTTAVSSIRVDGIQGELKVQVRSSSAPANDGYHGPPPPGFRSGSGNDKARSDELLGLTEKTAHLDVSSAQPFNEDDFM